MFFEMCALHPCILCLLSYNKGVESVNWVYSCMEDKQEWQLPSISSHTDGGLEVKGAPEDGDQGGTLWLPGGEGCVRTAEHWS
jgi:hypothetical protein